MKITKIILIIFVLSSYMNLTVAQSKNGFDLQGSLIPIQQILGGGPAKDGIPSIDNPKFVLADKADYLQDHNPVLGMNYKGVTKAYPINILNWHEIVNDRFNEEPVVITFCPLCGSGIAFSALINGKALTFGVSGLLYNSDVLLFDRQTESLWSQLMMQSISGPYKGKHFTSIPVQHTTWLDWKTRNPETLVLSTKTGFSRDYTDSPYADYLESPETMFPLSRVSRRYHPKEVVFGIEIAGQFKVYPFVELEKSPAEFNEIINGQSITIRYDSHHKSATAFDQQGKQLAGVRTFWFAWYAFHPETEIYVTAKP